jgi:hypothetical protein
LRSRGRTFYFTHLFCSNEHNLQPPNVKTKAQIFARKKEPVSHVRETGSVQGGNKGSGGMKGP